MTELVANLKVAMAARIQANAWMAPDEDGGARQVVQDGRSAIRTCGAITEAEIDAADLYGNVQRSNRFEWEYQLSDLGKPVDRKKWGMTPQTVDAYNGGLENKIVFPAGILQAPFFDPKADPAVNYGAIGAIIGHEISHGFDDQGRKIDATGAVRDWWTKADAERFNAQAKGFAAQYDRYEPVPGMHINGELTMGENIADFAGLLIAHDAYRASLKGTAAPMLDGFTGDQRFFLAFGQAWRGKQREDALRSQMASDPHTPDHPHRRSAAQHRRLVRRVRDHRSRNTRSRKSERGSGNWAGRRHQRAARFVWKSRVLRASTTQDERRKPRRAALMKKRP